MTITKRVRQQMLDGDAEDAALIRLEPHPAHVRKASAPVAVGVVRIPPSGGAENSDTTNTSDSRAKVGQAWSATEHERFLEALGMYPSGPWKLVAAHVGTRTTRQTMTHAQKYRQKIERQRKRSTQQQQQQQQQQEEQSQPSASKEDADSEAARRARAAMVTLQQAADVYHAGNGERPGPVGRDAATRGSNGHDYADPRRYSEASARSLMLSESSVSQAVVSLIQLAEPTSAHARMPAANLEPIGRKPSGAAVSSS